jgi:DeoR/GlpR family transcriptional regulator of sugar metabolism
MVEIVRQSGFCRSADLSRMFNVSEMTIRRDISKLDEDGLVKRVHGGAKAIWPDVAISSFRYRLEKNTDAKKAIAQRALSFIDKKSIIALDAGTTALELSAILPIDIQLTVVTHSLPAMNELSNRDGIEVIGLCGVLQKNTQAFAGPLTLLSLSELRVNTLFLGTAAVQGGALYSGNSYETEVKRALIKVADQVVLIADSSKFHLKAGLKVVSLNAIDAVITDDTLDVDDEIKRQVEKFIVVNVVDVEKSDGKK